MIQIGGVYTTFSYFCNSIALEMGGVSRYFSKISGSGVDATPVTNVSILNQHGQGAQKGTPKVL